VNSTSNSSILSGECFASTSNDSDSTDPKMRPALGSSRPH